MAKIKIHKSKIHNYCIPELEDYKNGDILAAEYGGEHYIFAYREQDDYEKIYVYCILFANSRYFNNGCDRNAITNQFYAHHRLYFGLGILPKLRRANSYEKENFMKYVNNMDMFEKEYTEVKEYYLSVINYDKN